MHQVATDDACQLAFSCPGKFYDASCEREGDTWRCRCVNAQHVRDFEVRGAIGVAVCDAITEYCVEDAPELGPLTCEPAERWSNADSCATFEKCGRDLERDPELGPEVVGRRTEDYSAQCSRTDGDELECQCVRGADTQSYRMRADSSVACDALLDFCKLSPTPEFEGPERCVETSPSEVTEDGCELTKRCGRELALGAGVTVLEDAGRRGDCRAPKGGVARCYCSTSDAVFGFDLETGASDANACETAIGNCSPGVTIEPTGSVSCAPSSQHSGLDFCEADLDCRQPITIDGAPFVGHGRLLLLCQEASDETWWCSCVSNDKVATIELGTAPGPWQACTDAVARCQEAVGVHIGMYGDFVPPPPPMVPAP